jgi:hypothetical protein
MPEPRVFRPESGPDRHSRRALRVSCAALATTLSIAAGSQALVADAAQANPSLQTAVRSHAELNHSLDVMAKLLAGAVTDSQLRREIRDGAAQRFDGDTNVLWKTLKNKPGVRSAIANAHTREASGHPLGALGAIDTLAAGLPRFQVAVPEKLNSWDPATYTPLVAYMPEGVDDTTLRTVTAYDASGKAYELDAQVAPSRPVIVLGLNERTDDAGNLLKEQQASQQRLTALASSYDVRMVKVHLINDNEPWVKGSAEISLRAKSVGCGGTDYTDIDWSSLNDDEDWWYGPRYLGSTTCDVIFYWWEDDGSSFNFTLSYKGISLNVQMDDGDDLIGGIRRAHSAFEGGSDNKSEWSDIVQWTD